VTNQSKRSLEDRAMRSFKFSKETGNIFRGISILALENCILNQIDFYTAIADDAAQE